MEYEEEGEPEPFVYTPIKEWGRTPEMIEELGDDATSLKGMVGMVPPQPPCGHRATGQGLAKPVRRL